MPTYLNGMFFRTNRKELDDRRIPWDTYYRFRGSSQGDNTRMHTNTTGSLEHIPVVRLSLSPGWPSIREPPIKT
jgi:hypothetical protein